MQQELPNNELRTVPTAPNVEMEPKARPASELASQAQISIPCKVNTKSGKWKSRGCRPTTDRAYRFALASSISQCGPLKTLLTIGGDSMRNSLKENQRY